MTSSRTGDRPAVSIILAGADHEAPVAACLDHVLEAGNLADAEIVLVGSAPLPDGLEQDVAVVRVAGTGRGLWADANRGAEAAAGRHFLFLDSGVRVLPGWLEPLLGSLDQDGTIACAGPGVLKADGTYREAGRCLVEGMPAGEDRLQWMPLAAGRPMTAPETAAPRQVTALGPHCLLVRGDEFTAAGGFDEGFEIGWASEDLCLRLAERGGRRVVRPESRIFLASDRFQARSELAPAADPDLNRFMERWQGHCEPDFRRDADGGLLPGRAGELEAYAPPLLRRGAISAHAARDAEPQAEPTVSVVVLTWNALDCTRDCIDSLLAHTDPRHEILLVDNGSQAPMQAYLDELENEPRVRVLRNGENLGFAAGNNVGLAAAAGDHVCLLNSDTVVTAGWLERLLAALEDPTVGLVGPVTNRITGGQQLDRIGYDPLSLLGLHEFAAARAELEAGRHDPALWIVGFCLLIRGPVIERIGGLDEAFGPGNYEDTDFCLRAFLAGYRAVVAQDAFVHHAGSRSFAENGLDRDALLDSRFEIFRAKWSLPAEARRTGDFDLHGHLLRGFLPPLHFEPLPAVHGTSLQPPAAWQLEAWCDRGEAAFAAGENAVAERIFRGVLRWDPQLRRAANDLACALWRRAADAGTNDERSATDRTAERTSDPVIERLAEAESILAGLVEREPADEDAAWNLQEIRAARRELAEETVGV